MNWFKFYSMILLFCSFLGLLSCESQSQKRQHSNVLRNTEKNTLVIYCENSLAPMVLEFEKEFERKFSCDVRVVNDCAGNLVELIEYSQRGDLFIPDALSGFRMLDNNSSVSITDSVFIGYNQLAVLVPANNPKKVSPILMELVKESLSVAIANPETSSLGFETRKMLESSGAYTSYVRNIVAMTVDAKGLDKMVLDNDAYYAFVWASNKSTIMAAYDMEKQLVMPEFETPIYLGMMSTSSNHSFAKYFLEFVSSEDGLDIVQRNGLKRRRSQVF